MDSKKKIYLLAPAVLFLWGYIFYKIVSSINPSDAPENYGYKRPTLSQKKIVQNDKPTLGQMNYADPFLKTAYSRKRSSQGYVPPPKKKEVTDVQDPLAAYHPYAYQGFVSGSKNKERIGLLTLKGQQRLCKEGEVIEKVTIVTISSDKIVVSIDRSLHEIEAN